MTRVEIERLLVLARLYRRLEQHSRAAAVERQLANEKNQDLVFEIAKTVEP